MTSPLTMAVYPPAGRLGLYVRAFQVFAATQPAGASVLDFGGGDVSVPVCFGDPVLVEDWGGAEARSAAVVGPRRHAVWLRFAGTVDQVTISFFPGAAGVFVGLAMPELVDRVAAPEDVWPRDFREAVAELEPLSTQQRISRLAELLLARLEPRREPGPQVREAVRLIRASRGRVTVRGLAGQVNLSVSQLERSFTRHVGVGPKLLARQTRLSALAAEAMTCTSPCWAWLAAKYGYADQAHLARDFRELTGLPPSGLAAERWPARHGCRAGLRITWCRAHLTCTTGSHESLSTDKALTAAALRSPSSAVPRRSGGLCGGRTGTGTGGPLGNASLGQRADGGDGWSLARADALAAGR